MSDASQGPGWWQASDGKWYPPEQAPGYQPPGGAMGGGAGGTDIGTVLTYAWNKFTQSIGDWVVLWLVMLGIYIVGAIIGGILVAGAGLGGGFTSFRFSPLGLIWGIILGSIEGIMLVAIAKGSVNAVNGQPVDVGSAFKFTTNNIIAGAIFGLALGFANSLCGLLGIVVFLFLGWVPVLSAMDDKGADAISESVNLATSKSSETMLYWLIGWFITGVVCFLGAPIAMIGATYMIKQYRGEPVY